GRTVAALPSVLGHEAFLEGVEGAVLFGAFHGHDLALVRLHREHRARLHGASVEDDRAGPAMRGVAADMGAGEAEHLADEVDEEEPGLDVGLVLLTVDRHLDVHERHLPPPPRSTARTGGR